MKKKISLLLLAIICIFTIVGCGAQEEDSSYDETYLIAVSQTMVDNFGAMADSDFEYFLVLSDTDLDDVMTSASLPITGENFRTMMTAWQGAVEECGTFVSCEDYDMEISSDGATMTVEAEFSEREAEIEFIFDEELNLDTIVVNPDYTIGEILTKAGLNTVLGMGTVFSVLIFIAFIISLFKYIPMIEAKFKKKPAQPEAAPAAPVAPVATALSDDTALIAVITAAIAASEGTSTDGFVVRSIRRRKSNKWNG